jgi:hypothetical protein
VSEPREFETMDANEDGWTDWVHPLPGYLMKCCDCGLVHEVDARVGRIIKRDPDNHSQYEWDDDINGDLIVMFRMKRP